MERLELVENILRALQHHSVDVMLLPGMPMPAQPLGYPAFQLGAISYTAVFNMLDFPAGSVPVTTENQSDQSALGSYPGYEKDLVYGWIKEGTNGATGMPLNVQLVGRPFGEEIVLRAMRDLQNVVGDGGLKFE